MNVIDEDCVFIITYFEPLYHMMHHACFLLFVVTALGDHAISGIKQKFRSCVMMRSSRRSDVDS